MVVHRFLFSNYSSLSQLRLLKEMRLNQIPNILHKLLMISAKHKKVSLWKLELDHWFITCACLSMGTWPLSLILQL